MNQLTKQQAIIISGYTGVICCKFSDFRKDVEKRLGRQVYIHEFGNEVFMDLVRRTYNEDFFTICYGGD